MRCNQTGSPTSASADEPIRRSGQGRDAAKRRCMTRQPNSTESVDPLADLTSEELSCLGLRRVNAFTEWLADLDRQALEACAAQQPKPPKPRKPPKPNLRTLVKQAEQATGKPVTS